MKPATGIEALSPREREVLVLMAGGLCNKAIARQLGITPNTVNDYLKRVFVSLDVHSRVAAAVLAAKAGLV